MSDSEAPRLRVLVVDDQPDVLDTTATVLSLYGHHVRTAARGGDALALIAEWQPHVALVDLGLPDMTGFDVAERVRSSTTVVQPLLIALTGWGRAVEHPDAQPMVFDHYFVKPMSMAVLQVLLSAIPTTDLPRMA